MNNTVLSKGARVVAASGIEKISQYALCKAIYTSGILNNVRLAPTSKLVLIALANHFNPNKSDMFPSQSFLACQLGLSLSSIKRAILELKQNAFIIYDTKNVNHYRFTNIFFEQIKLTPLQGQNDTTDRVNLSHKHKSEKKNNSGYFKNLSFNDEPKGMQYKKYEPPKRQEKKSPMDDYETAVKWLNALSENELKHGFIMERVNKVKVRWGID